MKKITLFLILLLSIVTGAKAQSYYAVNYNETSDSSFDRWIKSVGLTSQTYNNAEKKYATKKGFPTYKKELGWDGFKIKVRETVTPVIKFHTEWMHGYVYVDKDNDGNFEVENVTVNGKSVQGGELVSYNFYSPDESANGYNSLGEVLSSNHFKYEENPNLPAFSTVDLKPGFYRIRYKVDWNSFEPAGRNDVNNNLKKNGGGIFDIRLHVVGDKSKLYAEAPYCTVKTTVENEEKTLSKDEATEVAYGEQQSVTITPEEGKVLQSMKVRYGYGLDKEASPFNGDMLYWQEETVTPTPNGNGTYSYTIPADKTEYDVMLIVECVEPVYVNYTINYVGIPEGQTPTLNSMQGTVEGNVFSCLEGTDLDPATFTVSQYADYTSAVSIDVEAKIITVTYNAYPTSLSAILAVNNGYVRLVSGKYDNEQSVAFYRATANDHDNSVGVGADANNKDAEGTTTLTQIWQLIPANDALAENDFYIRNASNGFYVNAPSANQHAHPLTETPQAFYITPSSATAKPTYFRICSEKESTNSTQRYMHHDEQDRVVRWEAGTDGNSSAWAIVAATDLQWTVNLNASGINGVGKLATFSAPFATEVPEGVTAYYAETTGESSVILKEIGEGAIPANTGVMLELTEGDASSVEMKYITYGATVATVEGNQFRHTASEVKNYIEGENVYVLSGYNGQATFCKFVGGTIDKNKAYLDMTGAPAQTMRFSINFGDLETGIDNIESTENSNATIYDLSGRCVKNPVKGGLYIKGGVKYVHQ